MEIKEYVYNQDQIRQLYQSVGWTAYLNDFEKLEEGYQHSLLVLGAYEEDELLGIVRIVGDGYTIIFIQDILVFPQHQRKGVGRRLMKEILNRYAHVRQIELVTEDTEKTLGFYISLGFCPLNKINCVGLIWQD